MKRTSFGLGLTLLSLLTVEPISAQDVLRVASDMVVAGSEASIGVHVLDRSSTLLNEGDGGNLEIQGFAFRIDISPPGQVTPLDFLQAGVTDGKSPVLPVIEAHDSYIFVLLNFNETSNPLSFTLDGPPSGDLIGRLILDVDASLPPGARFELVLDTSNATLVNQDATLEESPLNGFLETLDGVLIIGDLIFADGFESGDTSNW